MKFLVLISYLMPLWWGFYAHKIINRHAVYCLPLEINLFYREHLDYLEESSVLPDVRKHSIDNESQKHYIDLEYYGGVDSIESLMGIPLDSLKKIYSEDTLAEWGILPWNIENCYYSLVEAFRDKNQERILKLSSDLGHYIADAHVPLHTTKNYNGQLTGQEGIHALWESQIPENFAEQYRLITSKADYIPDVKNKIWNIIRESHYYVDQTLEADFKLRAHYEASEIYTYQKRGKQLSKMYSQNYLDDYHNQVGKTIESRLRLSIHTVADFWFTAWVDSGQPELRQRSKRK